MEMRLVVAFHKDLCLSQKMISISTAGGVNLLKY